MVDTGVGAMGAEGGSEGGGSKAAGEAGIGATGGERRSEGRGSGAAGDAEVGVGVGSELGASGPGGSGRRRVRSRGSEVLICPDFLPPLHS